MAFIRSVLHLLWMALTVVPYTLAILVARLFGAPTRVRYRIARAWLKLSTDAARVIMGIRTRITGMEHLPQDPGQGVVLLVKHQSTYETFLMPAIMPRPLAYVFKKELLQIPFFGWSIGSLDMIHIDRAQRGARLRQGAAAGPCAPGPRYLGHHVSRGHAHRPRPEGRLQERRHTPRHRGRRARGAGGRDFGQGLATQGLRQAPRHRGCLHRPPHFPIGRKPDELMAEVEAWIEGEMRRLDPDAYGASGTDR